MMWDSFQTAVLMQKTCPIYVSGIRHACARSCLCVHDHGCVCKLILACECRGFLCVHEASPTKLFIVQPSMTCLVKGMSDPYRLYLMVVMERRASMNTRKSIGTQGASSLASWQHTLSAKQITLNPVPSRGQEILEATIEVTSKFGSATRSASAQGLHTICDNTQGQEKNPKKHANNGESLTR